jgi:hypothetical protein
MEIGTGSTSLSEESVKTIKIILLLVYLHMSQNSQHTKVNSKPMPRVLYNKTFYEWNTTY